MRRTLVVALAVLVTAGVLGPSAGSAAEARPGDVGAQISISLTIDHVVSYPTASGPMIYGVASNPSGSAWSATAVTARTTYYNAGATPIHTDDVPVDCWSLSPGNGWATFSMPFDPPVGFSYMTHEAFGTATPVGRVKLNTYWVSQGALPSGERWYRLRMQNSNAFTVAGTKLGLCEFFTPSAAPTSMWGLAAPAGAFQERLAPGEVVVFDVWSMRDPSPVGGTYNANCTAEAVEAAPTYAVYRFYNVRTGTHFYTIDPGERDSVIANLAWLYNFEGEAYRSYPWAEVSTRPLFRFYNTRTGTHFYTADTAERDSVIANLGWLYSYEGPAFFIANGGGLATDQMFRFYNKGAGTHFYTADPVERDFVIANFAWLYDYEGPAFNVPK